MVCRRMTYFTDSEMIEYSTKKWAAKIASLQKLKTMELKKGIMPDTLH